MAKIYFHPALTRFTDNQKIIELSIPVIGSLIPTLCQMFPRLADNLVNEQGELTPYINCYLNGKNVDSFSPDTQLMADAKIDIVTALVGG